MSAVAEELRHRHLDFYRDVARRVEDGFRGEDTAPWIEVFEEEEDNFRSALRWALDSGRIDEGVELADAISAGWEAGHRLTEGRRWLEQLLARGCTTEVARGRAAVVLSSLLFAQGDYDGAVARGQEAVEVFEGSGNDEKLGSALSLAGWALWYAGRPLEAESYQQRAVDVLRGTSDIEALTLLALRGLGWCALSRGDIDRAVELHHEALALLRASGNRRWLSAHLSVFANIYSHKGDSSAVRRLQEESLALLREIGDRRALAEQIWSLPAEMLATPGDADLAEDLWGEQLQIGRELGDDFIASQALEGLAQCAILRRDLALARTLVREGLEVSYRIAEVTEDVVIGRGELLEQRLKLALLEGDASRARTILREAQSAWRDVHFAYPIARSLTALATLAEDVDPDAAKAIRRTIIERLGGNEDDYIRFATLVTRSILARLEGNMDEALRSANDALASAERQGGARRVVTARSALADVLIDRNESDTARTVLEAGLGDATNLFTRTAFLQRLASVAVAQGNAGRAEERLRELGADWRALMSPSALRRVCDALAVIATSQERWTDAARLLGSAERYRQTFRRPRLETERHIFEDCSARVRTALGEESFRDVCDEGARLGEQVLAEALG